LRKLQGTHLNLLEQSGGEERIKMKKKFKWRYPPKLCKELVFK
jgi:hypothetical protein